MLVAVPYARPVSPGYWEKVSFHHGNVRRTAMSGRRSVLWAGSFLNCCRCVHMYFITSWHAVMCAITNMSLGYIFVGTRERGGGRERGGRERGGARYE